jgi:signal transduction histidine kinase/CheY-like chemotaxis protein
MALHVRDPSMGLIGAAANPVLAFLDRKESRISQRISIASHQEAVFVKDGRVPRRLLHDSTNKVSDKRRNGRKDAINGLVSKLRTQQRLRRSEDRIRALVFASSEVLYRMNSDWTEMRQLVSGHFLASTVEPRQTWLDTYIHPDDQAHVKTVINAAIATKSVFQLEHRVIRADGTLGWTHSRAVPLLDANGDVVEWFGAASDTTARHQHEEALLEADRLKDEFIATLAHELRNPLSSITSSVQLLEQLHPCADSDSPEGRTVRVLSRQTDHLSHLVHDLLDVARIAQNRLSLRREPIALRDVVDRAVEISGPQLVASGHRLNVAVASGPVILEGDPVRLTQIVTNLLDNAAKYSETGTEISLVGEVDRGHAVMRVRDRGMGIRSAFLPRAFERFTQDETMAERPKEGMGLGLTLVRSLVELHGGSVEIRSEGAGAGTEAVVRLPIAVQAGRDDAGGHAPEAPHASAHRVLLVDDNSDAADVLGMLLQAVGVEVRVAYDGAAALEVLPAFRPTAALIDLGMAPMDGFALARAIRSLEGFSDVVLVALTGWGSAEDKRRTTVAGFDHHMTKPVDLRDIQAVLASVASPSRPYDRG